MQLPPPDSTDKNDIARRAVRDIFELEGIPPGKVSSTLICTQIFTFVFEYLSLGHELLVSVISISSYHYIHWLRLAEQVEFYRDVFDEIFKNSSQELVYRGYSDDPRNTDNAWVRALHDMPSRLLWFLLLS